MLGEKAGMQPSTKLMEKNMSKIVKPKTPNKVSQTTTTPTVDPYEGLDSATKARKIAADKARIQATQTKSKLNVQD